MNMTNKYSKKMLLLHLTSYFRSYFQNSLNYFIQICDIPKTTDDIIEITVETKLIT